MQLCRNNGAHCRKWAKFTKDTIHSFGEGELGHDVKLLLKVQEKLQ